MSYAARNRERINAYARKWRRANASRINERERARRRSERPLHIAKAATRRKRNAAAGMCPHHSKNAPLAFKKSCLRCVNRTLKIQAKRLRHPFHAMPDGCYEQMLCKQRSACVCGQPFSNETPPHVDHCHATGVIRGLLCEKCNLGIGLARDSSDILDTWKAYLLAAVYTAP
jgi:hypothetical protein